MSSQVPVYINPYDCAKRGACFAGAVAVSQFKRLQPLLLNQDIASTLTLDLQFSVDEARESRLQGTLKGSLMLVCQRCLHSMVYCVDLTFNHVLCIDDAKLEQHKRSDTIFSEEDKKVRLIDLLEDDLLLALPFIAKHENIDDCQGLNQYLSGNEESIEKAASPFSILKDKLH